MMPGMTGLELCQRIREPHHRRIHLPDPAHQPEHRSLMRCEGMSAGADDYLIKPLNPDDLAGPADRRGAGHLPAQPAGSAADRAGGASTSSWPPSPGTTSSPAWATDWRCRRSSRSSRHASRATAIATRSRLSTSTTSSPSTTATAIKPATTRCAMSPISSSPRPARVTRSTATAGRSSSASSPSARSPAARSRSNECAPACRGLAISHAANDLGVVTVSAGLSMLDPGATRPVSEVLQRGRRGALPGQGPGPQPGGECHSTGRPR